MSSTDVRFSRRNPTNATNILGVPVTSIAPSNSDAMVYDATTGYYDMKSILVANGGDVTVNANDTFTGSIRIGAAGTPLHELRHYIDAKGAINLASAGTIPYTFTFTPAFSSPPQVQILAFSDNADDYALTVNLQSAPTVNGFDWVLANENSAQTVGNISAHIIAYI